MLILCQKCRKKSKVSVGTVRVCRKTVHFHKLLYILYYTSTFPIFNTFLHKEGKREKKDRKK